MLRSSFKGFRKIRIRILNKLKRKSKLIEKEDSKLEVKLSRKFRLDCFKLKLKKSAIICPINIRKLLKD